MESFKSRLLWLVAFLVISLGAVVYFSRPQPAVVSSVATSTSVAVSRATSTSQSVTTSIRTIKPDGTIIEQKQTIKKDVKVKEKRVEESKQKVVTSVTPQNKTRYRVGADWMPAFDRPPSAKDLEVRAGARLGNSNVWLEGGYDFKHGQAKIGISLEF